MHLGFSISESGPAKGAGYILPGGTHWQEKGMLMLVLCLLLFHQEKKKIWKTKCLLGPQGIFLTDY